MRTQTLTTELDEFQRYISERHGGALNGHTLDEAVEEFRLYQAQLAEVQEKVDRSRESAKRDGTIQMTPEIVDERLQQLNNQLANEGITD